MKTRESSLYRGKLGYLDGSENKSRWYKPLALSLRKQCIGEYYPLQFYAMMQLNYNTVVRRSLHWNYVKCQFHEISDQIQQPNPISLNNNNYLRTLLTFDYPLNDYYYYWRYKDINFDCCVIRPRFTRLEQIWTVVQ